MSYTNEALHALLSHPDAFVRANADWALQARRPVRLGMPDNGIPSYRIEDGLTTRLAALERNSLVASDKYYLD